MVTLRSPHGRFFPPVSVVVAARRLRSVAVRAAATLCFLVVAVSAGADPLVITSGILGFRSQSSIQVDVSGPGFALGFADTNPEDFGLPGLLIEHADPLSATLPVSGHILINLSAQLTLRDRPLPDCCQVLVDLTFQGNSPQSRSTQGGTSATGPFRVSGELRAFRGDAEDLNEVFRKALVGSGTATVGFFLPGGDDPPRPFATYTFESAAATPEPGTLLLLTSGAVGVPWRIYRSRKRG
jgi:hypothetical protein